MRQRIISIAAIGFLAWFAMRFYMDSANDTETLAYSAILFADFARGGFSIDSSGHATVLAQYVLGLFDALLQPVTGAYLIRGFVVAQLAIALGLFATAYAWYRRLGLSWLTTLLGLNVLSISLEFARQSHGWELDKLLEPLLYVTAALVLPSNRLAFIAIALLAALNRETGIFLPLIAARYFPKTALATTALSLPIVLIIRLLGSHPTFTLTTNLEPERLVTILGGFALTPVLGLVWLRDASPRLAQLTRALAPVSLLWIISMEDLQQGAPLLTLTALLFVPLTLQGVQATLTRRASAATPGIPAAPR